MNPKKKTGMKLSQELSDQKGNSWILSMIAVMLACISLIFIFNEMTGFSGGYNQWVMIIVGACLSVAGSYAKKAGKESLFYPLILFLLFIFVLLFRQQILAGGCLLWNRMGDMVTSNTGWVIPAWGIQSSVQTGAEEVVFSILTGMLFALFSCFMNTVCSVGLTLVLSVSLFIGIYLTGQEVSVKCYILVLAAALLILTQYGGKGRREGGAVLYSWITLLALFGILLPVFFSPGVRNKTAEFSNIFHEKIHEYRYETADTFLPEGDLRKEPETAGMDRTALIVTADVPEIMYLRGFTGTDFIEDVWSPLDKKVLVENEDLLYWLNLNVFYPDTQFATAYQSDGKESQSITIQNVNACSKYAYVPFHMYQNSYLEPENLNQEGVFADGQRTYVIETVTDGAGLIQEVLGQLQEAESEAGQEYQKAESAYRNFVHENYLQIPQETKMMMQELWKETASHYGGVDQLSFQQRQECVLDVLNRCFPEDGNTDIKNLPAGKAAGTSYQYATTAVMTLRYFGIPARYAEGFIITEEMAEKSEEGASIEVNGSCGAAWPEVYQDGIGWIPMALTPGMEEEEQKNQDNNNEGTETVIKEGEELEEEPDDMPDEPESEGGSMVTVRRKITGSFLKAGLVLLFFVAAVILRRILMMKKKEKRFTDENCKEAIGWIFADTAVLLEKMGFHRKNGSMEALHGPIREKLGEEYAEAFQRMILLNARALFSSHLLTEEERRVSMEFRQSTIEQAEAHSKWMKRIWMKWIQCLY